MTNKNRISLAMVVCLGFALSVASVPARADVLDDALAAHDEALKAMTDASIAKAHAITRCAAQVPPVDHRIVQSYVVGGWYQDEGNIDWLAAGVLLSSGRFAASILYFHAAKVHYVAAKATYDSIFPNPVEPPAPPM